VELRYLYWGTADTGRDLAVWLCLPGARLRWRFRHFGADVAAVDLDSGPPRILIADHRPAGSVLPIFAVEDLDAAVAALEDGGWTNPDGPVGTPEGPACVLHDPSGGAMALLRVDRPQAMETSYADDSNPHAVRSATA
jgi:hypothetical protein